MASIDLSSLRNPTVEEIELLAMSIHLRQMERETMREFLKHIWEMNSYTIKNY